MHFKGRSGILFHPSPCRLDRRELTGMPTVELIHVERKVRRITLGKDERVEVPMARNLVSNHAGHYVSRCAKEAAIAG
jgi:hypothetical protein